MSEQFPVNRSKSIIVLLCIFVFLMLGRVQDLGLLWVGNGSRAGITLNPGLEQLDITLVNVTNSRLSVS
jgi:hypothetical protein